LSLAAALAGLSLAGAAQPSLAAFDSDTYLSCAAKALAAQTSAGMTAFTDQPDQASLAAATPQLLTQLASLARDRKRIDPSVPFDELHQFLAGACYARSIK
jgi:hypothetical protein